MAAVVVEVPVVRGGGDGRAVTVELVGTARITTSAKVPWWKRWVVQLAALPMPPMPPMAFAAAVEMQPGAAGRTIGSDAKVAMPTDDGVQSSGSVVGSGWEAWCHHLVVAMAGWRCSRWTIQLQRHAAHGTSGGDVWAGMQASYGVHGGGSGGGSGRNRGRPSRSASATARVGASRAILQV